MTYSVTKTVRTVTIGNPNGEADRGLVISSEDYSMDTLNELIAAFRKWHEEFREAQNEAAANEKYELAERYSFEPWLFKSTVKPVTLTDNSGNSVTVDVNDVMGNGVDVSISADVFVVGVDMSGEA